MESCCAIEPETPPREPGLSSPAVPRSASLHLGNLHRERGDCEGAEVGYRKALERNPDHGSLHAMLGALLATKGDYTAAEQCHRAAIRCSKEDVKDEAYLNLGLVLRAQERYAEARASFSEAIALTPDYPEAIAALHDVQRAMAYLQSKGDS